MSLMKGLSLYDEKQVTKNWLESYHMFVYIYSCTYQGNFEFHSILSCHLSTVGKLKAAAIVTQSIQ